MKLTKIHSVTKFNESPWLAKYIDFSTKKWKEARMILKRIILN